MAQEVTQHPPGSEDRSTPARGSSAISPLPPAPSAWKALFPGICWQVGDYIRTTMKHSIWSREQVPLRHLLSNKERIQPPPAVGGGGTSPLLPTSSLSCWQREPSRGCMGAATFKKRLPFRRTWSTEAPLS